MSNYRVRQVLALGQIPERQLRLLVAIATYLDDDSRTVAIGFDTVITTAGSSRNTVKAARNDAREAGRLDWRQSKPGRGHLTLWTLLCLPVKGVNIADPLYGAENRVSGVDPHPGAEKGSTSPEKRGQPQIADQPKRDHGLNRQAKDSLSAQLAAMLATAVPGAAEREIAVVVGQAKGKGYPVAWLRKIIDNGDAEAVIMQAREQITLNGHGREGQLSADARPHSTACRRPGHTPADCAYGWCRCACHPDRQRLDEPTPLRIAP